MVNHGSGLEDIATSRGSQPLGNWGRVAQSMVSWVKNVKPFCKISGSESFNSCSGIGYSPLVFYLLPSLLMKFLIVCYEKMYSSLSEGLTVLSNWVIQRGGSWRIVEQSVGDWEKEKRDFHKMNSSENCKESVGEKVTKHYWALISM